MMILIIFLSSLKKNRKATFDVLFWGVLNSAFFVSMMELGVPNLTPPQIDPHELATGCTYCGVYFESHTECFVFCFESCVYSGGLCVSCIGGFSFWGCFGWGSRFGGHFELPELGLFLGARIGGSKIGVCRASRMSYLLRCSSGGGFRGG